jgi:SAM-dependent methyltransferase
MQQYYHILSERRHIWNSKKILRRLYHNWYRRIKSALRPGSILEIGGGIGNLKGFFPEVISSDILFTSWADVVLDAHQLPFHNSTFDNIVLFDVLHHLSDAAQFFCEAQKALKEKGRIVLVEPYISWTSFLIYRFLHAESLVWNTDPLKKRFLSKDKNHFHGNQAIPTLIFERYKHQFVKYFPRLKIIKEERTDFIIYPLSGGFHNLNLCPLFLYSAFEYLEKLFHPLNRLLAFRLFVVLEKNANFICFKS